MEVFVEHHQLNQITVNVYQDLLDLIVVSILMIVILIHVWMAVHAEMQ